MERDTSQLIEVPCGKRPAPTDELGNIFDDPIFDDPFNNGKFFECLLPYLRWV